MCRRARRAESVYHTGGTGRIGARSKVLSMRDDARVVPKNLDPIARKKDTKLDFF